MNWMNQPGELGVAQATKIYRLLVDNSAQRVLLVDQLL